jgi:N-acetylmuramoyl-L-alanine amidase
VSLPQRVAVVNALEGPAVFVSIHFNQGAGSRTSGVETFFALDKALSANEWTWVGIFSQAPQNGACEDLAAKIQAAVVAKTGARNRGALARDLYVIRHTRVPAILIEGGFISSKEEKARLGKDEYADQLAEGIADGVNAWYFSRKKGFSAPLAEAR